MDGLVGDDACVNEIGWKHRCFCKPQRQNINGRLFQYLFIFKKNAILPPLVWNKYRRQPLMAIASIFTGNGSKTVLIGRATINRVNMLA